MWSPITDHAAIAASRLLSQYQDKPRFVALIKAIAFGVQAFEHDLDDLVANRQLVIASPPTVLSLGPVALYRANYVVDSAGAITNWLDSSPNGNDADVPVGGNPNYETSYPAFGGLPAVTFFGVKYIETSATFEGNTGVTLIAGFVSTGITGNYDVVASLLNFETWIARNDAAADEFAAGVYTAIGVALDALDGRPHVVAVRRRVTAPFTATCAVWLDGVKIGEITVDATALAASRLHIGGDPSLGDPFTGAIGAVAYFDRALTDSEIVGAQADIWTNDLGQPNALGSAYGAGLEQYGAIVGEPRGGLEDADYRRFILARVLVNKSGGDLDTLAAILAIVFDVDVVAGVEHTEYFPMTTIYTVTHGVAVSDVVARRIVRMITDAKAAGVRVEVVEAISAPPGADLAFQFDGGTGTGFDEGKFARTLHGV